MTIEFAPFHDELLDDAATLLARRHQRDRASLPQLPERFEDPVAARLAVEAAWRCPRTSGVAALESGRVVGYLIGETIMDTLSGRHAWVPLAGHALEPTMSAELYRDLYAAAARQWIQWGCFDHYAMVPASDRAALDAWFALSFGQEQAHALRSLTEVDYSTTRSDRSWEIRRATPADRAEFVELSSIIREHLTRAPTWSVALPEDAAEVRTGYSEILDDTTWTIWLAVQNGQIAGFQGYSPVKATDDDLLAAERCIELKIAATREEYRGQGIGRALTEHGLAYAKRTGYRSCLADWRVTSLLASRFWPQQGFLPAAYRLVRRVDQRVLWTHGRR